MLPLLLDTSPQQLALLIPIVAIGGGFVVAIVGIIASAARKSVQTRHREETKRELAAYVAEGTMTAEHAERLLQADLPKWQRQDYSAKKA